MRFLLDVHLGTLARLLAMFGFDARYARDADDEELYGPRGKSTAYC